MIKKRVAPVNDLDPACSPKPGSSTLMQLLKSVQRLLLTAIFLTGPAAHALATDENAWFEKVKQEATPEQLYRFLYALPKGGDLHNHLSGSGFPIWWYELALKEAERGYVYYTKVRINNCQYGSNEYGPSPYLLLFHNLQESNYLKLDECQRGEYERLDKLNEDVKQAWLNSIVLDKSYEGRDEFFSTHWQRLNDLYLNPHLIAELLVKNMQAFGAEGLVYLETQLGARGYLKPDGSTYTPEETLGIYKDRMAQPDAVKSGVTVRLQYSLLRFLPNAEEQLKWMYRFVAEHPDIYVAVNMVGREDNDKGHPLRFLETLRELRKHNHGVRLSIHAGEVDEPNYHVRDTLLLGAERIGHGINLITDPDTLREMRFGPYMIEINLISNLLLEYVEDYSQHPFPEYLRLGIPVALSTDDRGMWDSNITDEFYVAVTEFNLSWTELVKLGRNSLKYSFLDETSKAKLLTDYDQRIAAFKQRFANEQWSMLDGVNAPHHGFICKWAKLCDKPTALATDTHAN